MVSKIIRRTPTKSIKKDCRKNTTHRRKKTPVKSSPSVVLATINESFFSCRRRLVKIFSKIVKLSTPKRSPKKHGFRKLKKTETHSPNDSFPFPHMFEPNKVSKPLFFSLPPLQTPGKSTVFLDLDETLIHSSSEPTTHYDFVVRPTIDGETMSFYVLKRPGVDSFLQFLSGKYEVVVFTAGLRDYASLVLDKLDENEMISHRLYRDSCREVDGKYVKDLAQVGRDLWKVVIVDDNPNSYSFQPENAIQIKPFIDDLEDNELSKLVKFFEACDGVKDIRDAVKLFANQPHLIDC